MGYYKHGTEQSGCISRTFREPESFSRRILLRGVSCSTQFAPHYITISRTSRWELYVQCSGDDVVAWGVRSGVQLTLHQHRTREVQCENFSGRRDPDGGTASGFFDVLLTVHLSIILATDKLNAQILLL